MDRINKIICPGCSNKLSKVLIGNAFIDICQHGCAGIWFDKNELKKVENYKSSIYTLFHIQKNKDVIVALDKERICPVCLNTKLVKHLIKGNFNVEIDECEQCGGTWLDASELEAFIKNDKYQVKHLETGQELRNHLNKIYNTETIEKIILMHNFVNSNLKIAKHSEGNDGNLICPACCNPLTRIKIEDMGIDICKGGCAGIWFDKDELLKVDEKHEKAGEILFNIEKNENRLIDFNKSRHCPRCKDKNLRTHFSSIKQQIEVDECDKCGGIWLDAEELDKIRNEFENEAEKNEATKQYFTNYSFQLYDETERYNESHKDIINKAVDAIVKLICPNKKYK